MNAEPGEGGIIELSNPSTWGGEGELQDLWTLQASQSDQENGSNASLGFTFPTCKPVKRIDYLFFRQRKNTQVVALPAGSRIIGVEASTDTGSCLIVHILLITARCLYNCYL